MRTKIDRDCIFCQIVRGKIPCYKVYEDQDFLGFLDINPLSFGHSLVIPKGHVRWVWEVKRPDQYWLSANKVGLAILKVLKAGKLQFFTVGELVPHAHIHVLPRYQDDGHGVFPDFNNRKKFSPEEMQDIADKIYKNIKVHPSKFTGDIA